MVDFFAQPFSMLVYFSLALKCAGFFLRDELYLRLLFACGMTIDMTFYFLQTPPIWPPILASFILLAINVLLVTIILFERTKIGMSARDKELFANFKTLNPGQFRRIMKHAQRYVLNDETLLLTEGTSVNHLYFVHAEDFEIAKRGQVYPAEGPAFVGEIAFLTGSPSSADVQVSAGTEVIAFDTEALQRLMNRSATLENGMIALFGNDLARKVARSVPMS